MESPRANVGPFAQAHTLKMILETVPSYLHCSLYEDGIVPRCGLAETRCHPRPCSGSRNQFMNKNHIDRASHGTTERYALPLALISARLPRGELAISLSLGSSSTNQTRRKK